MGYVNKSLHTDESKIKQAQICKLSYLDRYIAAVLFILGGIYAAVDGLFKLVPAVTVGEDQVLIPTIALAGVGVALIALMVLLAVYRLIQKIGKVPADQAIPGSVFGRLCIYGVLGIGIGLAGFMVSGTIGWVINCACGIVLGVLIIVFAIIRRRMTYLILTDKRVFGKRNIWITRAFDLPVDRVNDVEVAFSFWGKIFNYGTVILHSASTVHTYRFVKAPEEFRNLVMDFSAKYDKAA